MSSTEGYARSSVTSPTFACSSLTVSQLSRLSLSCGAYWQSGQHIYLSPRGRPAKTSSLACACRCWARMSVGRRLRCRRLLVVGLRSDSGREPSHPYEETQFFSSEYGTDGDSGLSDVPDREMTTGTDAGVTPDSHAGPVLSVDRRDALGVEDRRVAPSVLQGIGWMSHCTSRLARHRLVGPAAVLGAMWRARLTLSRRRLLLLADCTCLGAPRVESTPRGWIHRIWDVDFPHRRATACYSDIAGGQDALSGTPLTRWRVTK